MNKTETKIWLRAYEKAAADGAHAGAAARAGERAVLIHRMRKAALR